ncbi:MULTISPECIES: hypothetical protein [unclassified Desulfovibrio]|uniref:hypothetical protein n=1 Tax=unclassified Desulfovibrio TaxID=2593640 RepID=UPI000F5D6E46|nr:MULTISPECIES: hypothetical protein [unclassified Desulfovibrio]RRD71077.1 hypothetical protein EII24_04695 [Desulfovibrio sp. OH1209_COT-279]RRD87419.1 hypothetical protein EII23_04695 [Desulfovibrio sp. OH1186_COT-070]
MKLPRRSPPGISDGEDTSFAAQRRAARLAQKETNQRIEDLKVRLFRITEVHMDRAVRLIKRWLTEKE